MLRSIAKCQFWSSQRPFHHHDGGIALDSLTPQGAWTTNTSNCLCSTSVGVCEVSNPSTSVQNTMNLTSPTKYLLKRKREPWALSKGHAFNFSFNPLGFTQFHLLIMQDGRKLTMLNYPLLATIQTENVQDGQWYSSFTRFSSM